jgi:hypothetical protein
MLIVNLGHALVAVELDSKGALLRLLQGLAVPLAHEPAALHARVRPLVRQRMCTCACVWGGDSSFRGCESEHQARRACFVLCG